MIMKREYGGNFGEKMKTIAIAVLVAFVLLFLLGCTMPTLRPEFADAFNISKGLGLENATNIPPANETKAEIGSLPKPAPSNGTHKYANMFCYDVGLAGKPDLAFCDSQPKDRWCELPNYESCLISCYLCVAMDQGKPELCDKLNETLASGDVNICYYSYKEELVNPRSHYYADTGTDILDG